MEKLIEGDCINEMSKIKDQSVDMIFADPPYNLQLSKSLLRPDQTNVKGVNHSWDKFNSFEAYDEFTKKWDQISKQGFDLTFKRMWEFYLSYCEAGFKSKNINLIQFLMSNK